MYSTYVYMHGAHVMNLFVQTWNPHNLHWTDEMGETVTADPTAKRYLRDHVDHM